MLPRFHDTVIKDSKCKQRHWFYRKIDVLCIILGIIYYLLPVSKYRLHLNIGFMFLDIEKQYLKVIEDILEYTLDHRFS